MKDILNYLDPHRGVTAQQIKQDLAIDVSGSPALFQELRNNSYVLYDEITGTFKYKVFMVAKS